MKHLFAAALLLAALTANSQVTFQNGYGSDTLQDVLGAVLTSSAGEYVLVGSCNQTDQDITVFFLDNTGGVIASRRLDITGVEFGNAIVETDDGNFIIAGTTSTSPLDSVHNDIFVAKIGNLGTLVYWSKVFGGSGNDKANSI